jgi:serine/threonine-protein kinase RsbT
LDHYHRGIESLADVEAARRAVLSLAAEQGFPEFAGAELALVCSELATNLLKYARAGIIRIGVEPADDGRPRFSIEARVEGPGIPDVDLAMREGFSSANGLGEGLPMARRLSDEFHIESSEQGTIVRAARWI